MLQENIGMQQSHQQCFHNTFPLSIKSQSKKYLHVNCKKISSVIAIIKIYLHHSRIIYLACSKEVKAYKRVINVLDTNIWIPNMEITLFS